MENILANKRELREIEKMIIPLINEQLDVAFLLKTLSNIEYYMLHMIPLHKNESVKDTYYKYLNTAFKSLKLTDNQKIINADHEIRKVYDMLLEKYESEIVHECSACL